MRNVVHVFGDLDYNKFLITSVLSNIRYGCLTICTPTQTYVFFSPLENNTEGQEVRDGKLKATLRVRSPKFFLRLLMSGDLGLAEAFMFGDVDVDSDELVRVFLVSLYCFFWDSFCHMSPLAHMLQNCTDRASSDIYQE